MPSFIIVPAPPAGFNHGDLLTLTGGPYGTKSGSTPTLDDHGQDGAGATNGAWAGLWPNSATDPTANLKNRTAPFQALGSSTMNGPDPFTTTFLAGNHYEGLAHSGNQVMAWLAYTPPAQPWYSYWSWAQRQDQRWWYAIGPSQQYFTGTLTNGSNVITAVSSFTNVQIGATLQGTGVFHNFVTTITAVNPGAGTVTMSDPATAAATGAPTQVVALYAGRDNNNKGFNFSNNATPYDSGHSPSESWYPSIGDFANTGSAGANTLAVFNVPNSNTDTRCKTSLNDDGGFRPANPTTGALQNPDQNGHGTGWAASNNPADVTKGEAGTAWVKAEIVAKWTTASDGYFRYYENNVLIVNYSGPTVYSSLVATVCEALGGYARNIGPVPADTANYQSTGGTVGTYTQWRGLAKVLCDRQTTGLGRFVMTNSASYVPGDGNVAETQPYTGYGNLSSTIRVRKGNLNAGTAHLWFVDEANGVATPRHERAITLN
jgi:hypothetical protein